MMSLVLLLVGLFSLSNAVPLDVLSLCAGKCQNLCCELLLRNVIFLTGLMRFFDKFNLPSFVFFSVWSAILVYRALLNHKNAYIFAKVFCVADKFFIESSA